MALIHDMRVPNFALAGKKKTTRASATQIATPMNIRLVPVSFCSRSANVPAIKPPGGQLAFHPDPTLLLFNLHDDGGMWPTQQLRQNDPGLCVAVIIRLQSGEDQIEFFVLDSGRERPGCIESIQSDETVVLEVNGAIRP